MTNDQPHALIQPGNNLSGVSQANPGAVAIPESGVVAEKQRAARKWLIAVSVMLGAFMQSLDISIVNVALPHMQRSFGASVDQVTWVITSYLVAIGVVLPMTGWLAIRIGRRRYFIASVTSFMLASALCGAARSLRQIVIARMIQGAAGAAMMPLAQAILLETFPPYEHTLAMSTLSLGAVMAPVFGPTLGGWITMNLNWRWNFYINVPVSTVAALMVYSFVYDPSYFRRPRGHRPIDYMGLLYITAAFGLFELVISRGQSVGWFAAPWVRYCAALSALSVALLVVQELRFPYPVVDLRLFKIFSFSLAALLVPVYTAVVFTVNVFNPLFMQEVMGYDAWRAGLLVSPRAIGLALGLVAVGQLSRRGMDMRYYPLIGLFIAAYNLWQMSHWRLDSPASVLIWPIFVFGLAIGGTFSIITASAMEDIPRERMGFASTLFNIMANMGSATGIALFSSVLSVKQHAYQKHLTLQFLGRMAHNHGPAVVTDAVRAQSWLMAYHDIYRILMVMAVIVAPCCMLLKRVGVPTSLHGAVE